MNPPPQLHTHPFDIERAVHLDYSGNPAIRALQEESLAHIAVQDLLESRLRADPDLDICSTLPIPPASSIMSDPVNFATAM